MKCCSCGKRGKKSKPQGWLCLPPDWASRAEPRVASDGERILQYTFTCSKACRQAVKRQERRARKVETQTLPSGISPGLYLANTNALYELYVDGIKELLGRNFRNSGV
jgi:hypothetical protein